MANTPRGPDAQATHEFRSECHAAASVQFSFFASELRLRGCTPVVQPHVAPTGDVLCWNGEIFDGMQIDAQENDGVKLFEALCSLQSVESIAELLGSIEGPYAFVFYQKRTNCLIFARDPLGRRSLLISKPTPETPWLILASVSAGSSTAYELEELSTNDFYTLDLTRLCRAENFVNGVESSLRLIPRVNSNCKPALRFAVVPLINRTLPASEQPVTVDLDIIIRELEGPIDALIAHLDESVQRRVRDIPWTSRTTGKARVAVLFSGGIDSAVIAFLAHRHIPSDEPIDLLNVAFDNPRKRRAQTQSSLPSQTMQDDVTTYDVPDRLIGHEQLEELRRLCPERTWNFIEVDVPFQEAQSSKATIENLMCPSRSVMDLSLAMALYFASRGIGRIRRPDGGLDENYESTARVLLSGLGSDELLGGYGRHRTAFYHGGWERVIDELQLDLTRIPQRNLGRDDRVVSSHGKEMRYPFLSLSVVSWIAQLPAHVKMDPRLEPGVGDKMLLRRAARKLGLASASTRKKRAMQFGSCSARMEGGKGEKKGHYLLDG